MTMHGDGFAGSGGPDDGGMIYYVPDAGYLAEYAHAASVVEALAGAMRDMGIDAEDVRVTPRVTESGRVEVRVAGSSDAAARVAEKLRELASKEPDESSDGQGER